MRRRLLLSNLLVVAVLLATLETPLAIIYSRHEHDALNTTLQRDAAAVSALTQEILEHPSDHDVAGFTRRFQDQSGDRVLIVGPDGTPLSNAQPPLADSRIRQAIAGARSGQTETGEVADLLFVAVPLAVRGDNQGAVLVARSDADIDARVRRFWMVLLGLGGFSLVVVAAVSDRLARWVTRPLVDLGNRAAALGRGELHARADAHAGPSEVVALAVRFNEMADQLDELLASQRRFVADASHQLRTPLTALRLRLDNLDPEDPDAVVATRDNALQETARLSRLVDGLLALARAEGQRVQRVLVDVSAVVRDRQEVWSALAAENQIDLRLGSTPPNVIAELVPGHLEQILDNLIANAIEATPDGGVIECRVDIQPTQIEIHIIDDGHGMSAEERTHAFDPFWQGGNSSTGSTGLGLAIAQQLARASGGSAELLSSPAGGVDAVVHFNRRPESGRTPQS